MDHFAGQNARELLLDTPGSRHHDAATIVRPDLAALQPQSAFPSLLESLKERSAANFR
jgi:hypothetical protein